MSGPDRRRADVLLPRPARRPRRGTRARCRSTARSASRTRAQRGGDGHPRFPRRSLPSAGTERDDRVAGRDEQQTGVGRQRVSDLDVLAPSLASVGEVVRGELPGAKREEDAERSSLTGARAGNAEARRRRPTIAAPAADSSARPRRAIRRARRRAPRRQQNALQDMVVCSATHLIIASPSPSVSL